MPRRSRTPRPAPEPRAQSTSGSAWSVRGAGGPFFVEHAPGTANITTPRQAPGEEPIIVTGVENSGFDLWPWVRMVGGKLVYHTTNQLLQSMVGLNRVRLADLRIGRSYLLQYQYGQVTQPQDAFSRIMSGIPSIRRDRYSGQDATVTQYISDNRTNDWFIPIFRLGDITTSPAAYFTLKDQISGAVLTSYNINALEVTWNL